MLIIYRKLDGRVMACFSDESQTLENIYPENKNLRQELCTHIAENKRDLIDMQNYKVIDGKLVREVETENAWQ